MSYYTVRSAQVESPANLPNDAVQLDQTAVELLPPLVSMLHEALNAWGRVGYLPGPITADSVWFTADGVLVFEQENSPKPLRHVGLAPDLAAWLVLLDKYMETFVVIARARVVWSVEELAGALTFTSPAYLPPALVEQTPDNWQRVALALATAVADDPLTGDEPTNRHWNSQHSAKPA